VGAMGEWLQESTGRILDEAGKAIVEIDSSLRLGFRICEVAVAFASAKYK